MNHIIPPNAYQKHKLLCLLSLVSRNQKEFNQNEEPDHLPANLVKKRVSVEEFESYSQAESIDGIYSAQAMQKNGIDLIFFASEHYLNILE
jgi:hypothetical protein